MAKTILEEMGVAYVRQGDYLLHWLSLLAQKANKPVSIWENRHLRYFKQYNKVLYSNLLTSGKLDSYHADIDEQALWLVKQMAECEGVTEQLIVDNQTKSVGRMNNI